MTYLGTAPGGKGWIFMRTPNNIVFTAAQAIFDESMFPKCPALKMRPSTRLQSPVPPPMVCPDGKCDCQGPPVGDDEPLPSKTSGKRSFTRQEKGKARDDGNSNTSLNPTTPSSTEAEPPTSVAPPQPPTRRLGRACKVLKKEGNVYSDKHPVQIEQDICQKKDWDWIVGEQSSRPHPNVPGPSTPAPVPPPPHQPQEGTSSGEEEMPDSESEVEDSLEPSSGSEEADLVARLAQEGGVHFQHFLVSKAISPNAEDSSPKEWTYRDLLKLPKECLNEWKAACERELDALNRRHVFDLVECPKGQKVIRNRWVFDVKDNGRKRAHLVAKGFSQVEGMDYDQVFSPVVRFETVRLIISMAALENWHMHGLDVRNAYLYGELDEEIYMEQPEGFSVPGKTGHVLCLQRALYRLKQAGLAWWRALKQSMEELGFTSLASDAGVFYYRGEGSFVVAIIYVDDAIFCGPSKPLVLRLKEAFMKKWETRDLGEVTEFLHMHITRQGSSIHLDQCAYLKTAAAMWNAEC